MASSKFRIMLSQSGPTVGALDANCRKAADDARRAAADKADLIVFPEMFISGYPAKDLVRKHAFVRDCMDHVERLAQAVPDGPAIGIGAPCLADGHIYNAFFLLEGGAVTARIFKHHLPNYSVFDEAREFEPGAISGPVRVGNLRIGFPICEDAWHDDVCEALVESGAEFFVVPNGSPYRQGKRDERIAVMVSRVIETGRPLAYLNMTGAQDDQVFDGGSFLLNPGGGLAGQLPTFDECLEGFDLVADASGWKVVEGCMASVPPPYEQDYRAMVQAVGDYARKSGFSSALLGLSGGIDSALVALIACDALGADAVQCVTLPSLHTSDESIEDAAALIETLGCRSADIAIGELQESVSRALKPVFGERSPGLAEENIQSRLRGLLLMALANEFGGLLLTTGNKSEAAVGYATIYGDMAGGYNPIKDLYKTRVYEIAEWRNQNHRDWMSGPAGAVIPRRIFDKPPSAELRPGQRDCDSLPPYDRLDGILRLLIDEDQAVADATERGFDPQLVSDIERLIYASEYKRFQSAPGARLSNRALWLDRRYPIVNHWRDTS